MFQPENDSQGASPTRAEMARARGTALRLLSQRPRTVEEMRKRLGQRFSSALVDQTVARLEAEGLLSDADFARQWRESRERRRPRSRSMIAQELKQRGVSGDIIDDALGGFDSSAAAVHAASRYAARQAGCDRSTFDRRVGAFLSRRGFESGVIRETVMNLRNELRIADSVAEEPADFKDYA